MKLLFFSDVHGSPESLELLERHIDSRSPDLLVLLGDALYHGPRNPLRPDYAPPQVVEQLNRRKELLVDGHRFFLTHGHLWNPGQLPPIPAGTVFTYGHTHLPQLERLENGRIAFNPGSISLPKGGNPASFGFYEDGVLTVCRLQDAGEMLRLSLEP